MGKKTIHLIVIAPVTDLATVAFILLPGQDLEVLNWLKEPAYKYLIRTIQAVRKVNFHRHFCNVSFPSLLFITFKINSPFPPILKHNLLPWKQGSRS